MPPDDNREKLVHITFAVPARAMLMNKSTPLCAVSGTISVSEIDPAQYVVRAKWLFPINAAPVKASITLLVNRAHVVSIVEGPTP